jgi:hypothetical protein
MSAGKKPRNITLVLGLEGALVEGATGIQIVRLEIFEEPKIAGEGTGEPLVSVDLAVPDGEDPPEKDDTENAKRQKVPG